MRKYTVYFPTKQIGRDNTLPEGTKYKESFDFETEMYEPKGVLAEAKLIASERNLKEPGIGDIIFRHQFADWHILQRKKNTFGEIEFVQVDYNTAIELTTEKEEHDITLYDSCLNWARIAIGDKYISKVMTESSFIANNGRRMITVTNTKPITVSIFGSGGKTLYDGRIEKLEDLVRVYSLTL